MLQERLASMQCMLQGMAKGRALPTAFVTFKDTFTSTVAATSMMHHDLRHWTTRQAPSPRVYPVATLSTLVHCSTVGQKLNPVALCFLTKCDQSQPKIGCLELLVCLLHRLHCS